MNIYVQLLMNSVQIGSVYVLFSLGLTLIFGVMRVVNFAHGEIFALAALLMAATVPSFVYEGIPPIPSYIVASFITIGVALLLGKLLYEFGFRKFQQDMIGSFVLSIGLALLLQGILLEVFTGSTRTLPSLIEGHVSFLGGTITIERIIISGLALIAGIGLCWMIASTKLGVALRAVSEDPEAAMLQGIPYRRIAMIGFLIGTSLAAIAGILVAPVAVITPSIGANYLIKGFIAVVIGGLGSIPGAILGSILIALVESIGGYYFDPSKATIAMFFMVMVVLLIRPYGLMGKKQLGT